MDWLRRPILHQRHGDQEMTKYIKLQNDLVLEAGVAPDGLEPQGSVRVDELPRPIDGTKTYYRAGKYVYTNEPRIVSPRTYVHDRVLEYPPIAEQLDALWHAMDEGLLPKIEPMYSSILAVKQK